MKCSTFLFLVLVIPNLEKSMPLREDPLFRPYVPKGAAKAAAGLIKIVVIFLLLVLCMWGGTALIKMFAAW